MSSKARAVGVGSRGGKGCGTVKKPKQNCDSREGCKYFPKVGCRRDTWVQGKSRPRKKPATGCSRARKAECSKNSKCAYIPRKGCRVRGYVSKDVAERLGKKGVYVKRSGGKGWTLRK